MGSTVICTVPTSNETGRKRIVVIGKTASGGYVADSSYFYVVNSSNFCESIQSGDWSNASTWSCGHEPTVMDAVIINPGNTVYVSTTTPCRPGNFTTGVYSTFHLVHTGYLLKDMIKRLICFDCGPQ